MSIQQNFKRNVFIVLGLVIHACLFTNYCCAQDMSILQHSLDVMEKRRTEAYEEYSKLQVFLSDYQYRLNNDEETLQWFLNYKNSLFRTVEGFMNLGDYANARKYAVLYRGEIAGDPELNARVRTSREYQEIVRTIRDRADMSWQEKEDWIKNNPYCFIPIKNYNNNEVIGGRLGSIKDLEEYQLKEKKRYLEMQLEKERQENLLIQANKKRIHQMENPFEKFDYSGYDTIISNPSLKKLMGHNIHVAMVALSETETRIELEIHYATNPPKNEWRYINEKTYIKASGSEKLYVKKIDNLESAQLFKEKGEKVKFALTFPALPKNVKSFILTPPKEAGWEFKRISCESKKR